LAPDSWYWDYPAQRPDDEEMEGFDYYFRWSSWTLRKVETLPTIETLPIIVVPLLHNT